MVEGRAAMSSYETDFYAWTKQQAAAIRAGDWDKIERERLAEEIEDLYNSGSLELWDHLRELMVWLVAWCYSDEMRQAHPWWYVRIIDIRIKIDNIVHLNPRVRPRLEKDLAQAYAHGREVGAEELGVVIDAIAETCPWTTWDVLKGTLDGPTPLAYPRRAP
jgi:hypothetical protein